MRRGGCQVAGCALALLVALVSVGQAADVHVNINLGPPPVIVQEPPALVLVPGSSVYFVPDYDFDIFFYDGYWWSPRGDRWYRSYDYNGPWKVVSRRYLPRAVYSVPRDYRHVYVQEERIPYGQWKKRHGRHGGKGGHGGGGEHRGRGHGHDDHGHDDHGHDDHGHGRGRGHGK